jgi:hypothetical protein
MAERSGTYHASYIVHTLEDATAIIGDMANTVASSFGEGDDQWEGIDLADAGAIVTMLTEPPDKGTGYRYKWIRIEVRIPVEVVPDDYWLSPYISEGPTTYRPDGTMTGGEPYSWGMKFLQPQRKRRQA